MLNCQQLVPSSPHLRAQRRQLRCALLPRGSTLQLEAAIAGSSRDVRESQEVERLRPRAAVAFAPLAGVAPEPQYPGLLRV